MNVVPTRTQDLLLGSRLCTFTFAVARLGALPSLLRTGVHLASAALASFHFTQPQ
jgi:hypothetical protein